MALIQGKQLKDLLASTFYTTGDTATNGQMMTYNSGTGGVLWSDASSLAVTSITAGDGLSGNTTLGDVTLQADVDGNTIAIDSNSKISLGDSLGQIAPSNAGSGNYTFLTGSDVIITDNLTVQGTTTFLDSENTVISDNIILINSGATAGYGTAGISVDLGLGGGETANILWNEANGGFWGVENPAGSGSTTSLPIITTDSLTTSDSTIVITQGSGDDIDKLDLVVDESNFSNIPNSALTNSSISVTDDNVVTATTSVALGGTLTLGLANDSITEAHLNAISSPTDNFLLSYDSGSGGFDWVDVGSITNDTYLTGGTSSYGPTESGTLTLGRNNGELDISIALQDTFITGGTLTGDNIVLDQNDGTSVSVNISDADFNDTFSTGGTVTTTPDTNSNSGTVQITGNEGFGSYTITGVNDTYTTGTSVNSSTGVITHYRNDGVTYTTNLSALDFNDTFVTGGTVSNGSLTLNRQDDTISVLGTIVESVTGDSPITASTTNGDVSVGIDYTSLQLAVPTTSDKDLTVTATTVGNNSDTGLLMTTTPTNDGYVGVSINGVSYVVGSGVTTKDCYFSSTGAAGGVRAFADIVEDDKLVWNGTIAEFEVDGSDRVDFYYNILQ